MDWKAILKNLINNPDPETAGVVAWILRSLADLVEKNPKGLVAFLKLLGLDFK